MPSSVNVPSSISSASRSRAVSLSAACCLAIFSSPPPSRACARRSCSSSTSGRRTAHSSGSTHRLDHRGEAASRSSLVLGRLEGGDLEADDRARPGELAEQVAQALAREPAGRRELRREARSGRARRGRGARRRPRPSSAPASRSGGAVPTPARSSSTRSPPSRSRTPVITTRAGSTAAPSPSPASQRPHAAARHMPPRKPLGVVVGRVEVAVGVEPHDARVGHVAQHRRQRRHADRAVARRAGPGTARRTWRRRPGRRPRAGSRATRAGRPSKPPRRASPGEPTSARLDPEQPRQPRRQRVGAPRPAGRAVRGAAAQRDDATRSPARPLRLALLEEGLARPPGCRRSRRRSRAGRAGSRARPRRPCPAGGTSRPCPSASAPATWPPAAPPSRPPRRRTPSAGTTRLTIPIRSASSAEICSPSSSSSLVFLRPTLR